MGAAALLPLLLLLFGAVGWCRCRRACNQLVSYITVVLGAARDWWPQSLPWHSVFFLVSFALALACLGEAAVAGLLERLGVTCAVSLDTIACPWLMFSPLS
jgi:hypothetical protein